MATGGLTGVLLVGGASRRFGSPKALADLDGETLAARAWRTLGAACDERLAVGKRTDALPLPFDLTDDGTDVRAPIAGVVAGLRAARNDLCVFLPVDTPFLRPNDLRELAAQCLDVAVPPSGPLPGAYRRSSLPVLERRLAAGQLALRDALPELQVQIVDLDARALENVNEPTDLARLAVEIVPFRPEHTAGFAALVAHTLREFGFEPDRELDRDLDDPGGTYAALWIALVDDRVAGSVALRDAGDGVYVLKRMYLDPSQRGRGLGKRLLATALGWARANGADVISLDTTERMVAARGLYEAAGFVQVPGESPRQGQRRLLYELRLGAP
jgi:molybdopterin-guanine dinucleotide biosynthesis protein A/N-acetylglutamate synthase-like GNAT family acetyltransferase